MAELNGFVEDPTLWNDPERAQKIMRERTDLENRINGYLKLDRDLKDSVELIELGEMEDDATVVADAENTLRGLKDEIARQQVESMLSGEADANDTYIEVNSGAGGTESQDWTNMLLRMYTRWAEKRGYKVEVLEVHDGEEAGIKSATVLVKGHNAYGWLKTESGVHRLVRISPFDSQARRHTAFASVMVVPFVEEEAEAVEIDEKDLRIDTYRSSGAGGQHVNVTDSAVRITHLPTGIVTSCQNERSQHQNKDRAMAILAAKLADLARQEREAELAAIAGETQKVEWGSQIRSYFVHPEQRVKDHRTNWESGNVEGVFDGDVEPFMEAYLRWRRADAASS